MVRPWDRIAVHHQNQQNKQEARKLYPLSNQSLRKTWQQVPLRTKAQRLLGFLVVKDAGDIMHINYAPSDPNIVYFVADTSPGVEKYRRWDYMDSQEKWFYR